MVMAVSSGLSSILRCFGFSKATVITNLTTVTISLLLNVFVIKFPHISPITGVAGVAASTVVSQIIGLLLNIYFIKNQAIKFLIPKNFDVKPKKNRNEPKYLPHILNTIALCMGIDSEELATHVNKNTKEFFKI